MGHLKQNQYIKHNQYGLGVISQSNAERTTVEFESHGVKKFVTDLMQYELLADQPPVEKSLKQKVKRPSRSKSTKSKVDQDKT